VKTLTLMIWMVSWRSPFSWAAASPSTPWAPGCAPRPAPSASGSRARSAGGTSHSGRQVTPRALTRRAKHGLPPRVTYMGNPTAPPGVHVNVTSGSRNVDSSAQINVTSQSPESLGNVGFLELGIHFKTYARVFFYVYTLITWQLETMSPALILQYWRLI